MELSVVLSRPLISDIIKGFFAVRKAVISPTEYNVTLFLPGLDIQKI
jgi:hypothetical protein